MGCCKWCWCHSKCGEEVAQYETVTLPVLQLLSLLSYSLLQLQLWMSTWLLGCFTGGEFSDHIVHLVSGNLLVPAPSH
ncbi:unnamed protein product [Linum trigynum]|uniref:Uncharacterized protein n=1 Tax=Linum trigynum TaxID=586398 RepID=A0AAV2EZS7_9ROSI